ncbi:DUF4917 family protein [Xanthobacter oligotrophicus]|uniref:DUF4917 family protein n=1 Tax=Xanthobacter oligotrophicus TaxID=2607286 RepID=UPI0011F0BC46|nr:DUF4917 family protein [Xanthobacter oligotrophicus]MCG5234801.1 DUF4917 family protein [Xanthobacter oligotrophicus]
MPPIISFDDAISATANQDRALLIGNGFSSKFFSYKTLLDSVAIGSEEPVMKLFKKLDTFDFESVIRSLTDAAAVSETYGDTDSASRFLGDADSLRAQLVHAIRANHPTNRTDIETIIPSCIEFLNSFNKFFSLNYDLLLYWVLLENPKTFVGDGFGLGVVSQGMIGPFKEGAYCNTYYLHGGLHLFSDHQGDIHKHLKNSNGIIDAITSTIENKKKLPTYVAEGTSWQKVAKINSVEYLRFCYTTLGRMEGNLFIFGHSAADNDSHIYNKIFSSNIEHIYFGVYRPNSENIAQLDSQLARYQRLAKSKIDYTFYDAESAKVWDRITP